MMNKRIYNILQLLLEQSEPLTVDQIAGKLQVSNKTIRNDLKQAQELCNPYHVVISKKTGTGVELLGNINDQLSLKRLIEQKLGGCTEYSLAARRIFLSLRLLNADEPCVASQLSKELYTSKATIHKDIRSIRTAFQSNKLDIVSCEQGFYVKGKERHIRDTIFDFMHRDNAYYKLSSLLLNPDRNTLDNEFLFPSMDYRGIDFKTVFQIARRHGKNVFSDLSFQRTQALLLRIFINVIRVMEGHSIELSKEFISQMEGLEYYEDAKSIYDALAENYGITFDELEIQYLRTHINSTLVAPLKEKQDIFQTYAKEFTYCLIQSWKQKLKYPFDKDKKLFDNLLAHCRPAMLRFQHAIPIENPLLQTIKFQFKNTFNITKQCCKELSIQFNVEISEDEIGFLALHLANALDRNKRPLNTLLVSDNGLGINELLIERINTLVPYITVNKCVDILEVVDVTLSKYDFILCTSDTLYIEDIPTVFIGSILNESDIIRLNRIGYKYYKEINNPIIKIQNSN